MRAVGLLKIWVINCLLFYLPPKSLTEICRTAKTKSVVRWHCGDCLGYAFCLLKFYYIETPLSDLHSLICMSSYRDTGACEAETAFTKCLGNHQLFPVSFWVRLGPCNKLSSEMWAEPNLGAEEAKNQSVSSTLSSPVIVALGASPEHVLWTKEGLLLSFIVSVLYCLILECLLVGHWTCWIDLLNSPISSGHHSIFMCFGTQLGFGHGE